MFAWKQLCPMCKKWFLCSHTSREYCFECSPKLLKDEIKPRVQEQRSNITKRNIKTK